MPAWLIALLSAAAGAGATAAVQFVVLRHDVDRRARKEAAQALGALRRELQRGLEVADDMRARESFSLERLWPGAWDEYRKSLTGLATDEEWKHLATAFSAMDVVESQWERGFAKVPTEPPASLADLLQPAAECGLRAICRMTARTAPVSLPRAVDLIRRSQGQLPTRATPPPAPAGEPAAPQD